MGKNIVYEGRTVEEILNDIHSYSENSAEKGTAFEDLFFKIAPLIPHYEISEIERPPGKDTGIDLVATKRNGDQVAIQCKFYKSDHKVSKSDIQQFIAGSKPDIYPERWIVAANDYTDTAISLAHENHVHIIDFRPEFDFKFKDRSQRKIREPYPLQQEAIDSVIKGFKKGDDVGNLVMACGTGKTFVSLRIAEILASHDNANILFIAPSIALVSQARREYLTHSQRKFISTVVCSDNTSIKRSGSEDIGIYELECRVITDPKRIAAILNKHQINIIFCTYQSLDKISDAQIKHNGADFDLVLIDEAHRTTGVVQQNNKFQLIHDKNKIKANKRLYMTATPRIYDIKANNPDDVNIVDMSDDSEHYGERFYHLSFKKAIEAGLLSDYKVIALGIEEGAIDDDLKDHLTALSNETAGNGRSADQQAFLALGAIALAINGIVISEFESSNKIENDEVVLEQFSNNALARVIAYASNIRRSKWFNKALGDPRVKNWIDNVSRGTAKPIKSKHLDGTSNALSRNQVLADLRNNASKENPMVVTNAKLFTEGVDVPALNAIAFLDPRNSKVDTIQAVGRVMRKHEDKDVGYIIVPVILPPGSELLEVLGQDKSRFKCLGSVLSALQSHDERLYTQLDKHLLFANIKHKTNESISIPPETNDRQMVQLELLDENAKQSIFTKIAKLSGITNQNKVVADSIIYAVGRASQYFKNENVSALLADDIDINSNNEDEVCKTAALLIINACIMHQRLGETDNLLGLKTIKSIKLESDFIVLLVAEWEKILEKDYRPIFKDAVELLKKLPHENNNIRKAITSLIECAISNSSTLNEMGFDYSGPLYHKILGTAKSDGAFYTKNLSAYLLANLIFNKDYMDWTDIAAVKKLKIIDPACGTGTLLMASLNTLKKRVSDALVLDGNQLNELHQSLVESCLYGFDINKYGIQLAACNLTIGVPTVEYASINLYTLKYGPTKSSCNDVNDLNDVRHGSIEKIIDDEESTMHSESARIEGTGLETDDFTYIKMPTRFDVAIFNPPFTDTSKSGTRFNKPIKDLMDKRLAKIKELIENHLEPDNKIIARNSIQPYFTVIANRILNKTDEGGGAHRKGYTCNRMYS